MADFDVARARAAGYTDAEIQAALGQQQQPLGVLGMIASGLGKLLGTQSEPPQAMTRLTRTPVRWGSLADDTYGSYSPVDRAITMNADKLPQTNPNDEYMSNVLRHEQVHALLSPETVARIQGYFDQNPQLAATGRTELSRYAPDAGSSNKGLAQEAPAYAVQGYRFGMGDETVDQYKARMSQQVRSLYEKLLRK